MDILVDTGVLLRLVISADPLNAEVRRAIKVLRARGDRLITLTQNTSEFWNVCTRPPASRGGYGFSVEETARKLKLIERLVSVRADSDTVYEEWKRLLIAHDVKGVKVHDTRIVAAMKVYGMSSLLTFNGEDFKRFAKIITVVAPKNVI